MLHFKTVKHIHKSAWLLALSSGALQILVFPKPSLYFLCWIALSPLIYTILRAREADASQLLAERDTFSYLIPATIWQGFLLGWASGIVFYAGTCYWVYQVMHLYGALPPAISAALLVLFSLFIGLHHGVFGALLAWAAKARAGFSRRALVLTPFLWVSVELLRAYVVSFPWNLLGTAQVENTPLAQIATVTGVYGVSFEIMVVNAAFAAAFLVRPGRRRNLIVAAITAAVALQATKFVSVEPSPSNATAILVQQNIPQNGQWTPEYFSNTLFALQQLSQSSTAGGAAPRVVVWPESPSPFYVNDNRFVSSLASVAHASRGYVIAGSIAERTPSPAMSSDEVFNSAVLISPEGLVAARYDKIHLVPWGEYVPYKSMFAFANSLTHEVGTFERGASRMPLDMGNAYYGVFICYESIFPHEVREFADRGAQVFVNISNDGWFGESGAPAQHLNMARMRAIENERWLLRATNTGITASIDPLGRVVARAPVNQRVTLEAPYMLTNATTFYTRNGDWFPISCAIISLAGLLWRRPSGGGMAEPEPV